MIDSLRVSAIPDPITGYAVDINGVGVAGAAVSIFDAGGNVVATATTDITGFYFFATVSVLNQGVNYTVAVTGLPPGFVNTPPPSPAFMWSGSGPIGIAFDGANIWVANTFSNNVTELRASDGTTLATFPVGPFPRGIAFDGANIWVANSGNNTVSKL